MVESFDKEEGSQGRHLLTASQLAAILQVNMRDLYRRAVLGEIPSYKLGKSRRFKLDEVLAAMRDPGPVRQSLYTSLRHQKGR